MGAIIISIIMSLISMFVFLGLGHKKGVGHLV